MNVVKIGRFGVVVDGAARTGVLCGDCAAKLRHRRGVLLFQIDQKEPKKSCDGCAATSRQIARANQ